MSAALKLKLDFFTRAAAALEFNLKEVKEEVCRRRREGGKQQAVFKIVSGLSQSLPCGT